MSQDNAGFVGYDKDGHFVHYCHCGKWGDFGHDYFPRQGKLGVWFCSAHNPKEPEPEPQPEQHSDVLNDLQELVAFFGGYDKIPLDAWEQWDRQQVALRAAMIKRPE